MNKNQENKSIEDASSLEPRLIYEVIRREGDEELDRPVKSLIWSGVAAGLMISFSVLGEAILRTHLGESSNAYLIENLGYSLGFMMVILGRLQLFTENTITTVLPLMAAPSATMLTRMLKLWAIVLGANVVGAFVAASLFAFTPAIPSELLPAIKDLSEHALGFDPSTAFFRAIPAGILVAALVWTMPQAGGSKLLVIVAFTWLIAAGDFAHIVAGSVEMWFLLVTGSTTAGDAIFAFFLPVLAGNVVGGTLIFALLAYGQVHKEIAENPKE